MSTLPFFSTGIHRLHSIQVHGGARRHDWHHAHQVGNYGGFWFWDWLCGTEGKDWQVAEKTRSGKGA